MIAPGGTKWIGSGLDTVALTPDVAVALLNRFCTSSKPLTEQNRPSLEDIPTHQRCLRLQSARPSPRSTVH